MCLKFNALTSAENFGNFPEIYNTHSHIANQSRRISSYAVTETVLTYRWQTAWRLPTFSNTAICYFISAY